MKCKVVVLKKLVFQRGICFLIQSIFDRCHSHLVDFKGERDPLQQNGLHGQYQFGFIVSKTCCIFLVEFVSSFFLLKWRVHGVLLYNPTSYPLKVFHYSTLYILDTFSLNKVASKKPTIFHLDTLVCSFFRHCTEVLIYHNLYIDKFIDQS